MMDFLELPNRTTGNRTYGLTSVIDLGISIRELKSILEDYHSFIDVAKIGIGSAYVTPNLREKLELYKVYGVKTYCGGTLFEKCYIQNKLPEYFAWLKHLGIQWIEVSNGTIDIPLQERCSLISKIKEHFRILAEVGSKDNNLEMSLPVWREEMKLLLRAGADYIITEGRDSGTSGIYQKNGAVKSKLVSELVKDMDVKRIIFEAPTTKQQMYFINEIGANVNLGNIKLHDVLQLETQRLGLRSETFYLEVYEDANNSHQTSSYSMESKDLAAGQQRY